MGYTCSVCDKYFEGNPRYFVCGKNFDTSPLDSKSICSDECYHKHFWTEALDNKAIIVNGECYHVGPENSSTVLRGFGGRKFIIQLKNGRKITTTNLWSQGKIPEEFYREDNAVILKG